MGGYHFSEMLEQILLGGREGLGCKMVEVL